MHSSSNLKYQATAALRDLEGIGDPTSSVRSTAGKLTFGEIHTGLLQNSTALPSQSVRKLVDVAVGERVRYFERPIEHALSPDRLNGVDCTLPSKMGRTTRCVGTVIGHVGVIGGHVVQGSSQAQLAPTLQSGRRPPWSRYLARPGMLEPYGKMTADDVASGFLSGSRQATTLDVGAISGRGMDEIQSSTMLDRKPPFRSRRTVLRWVMLSSGSDDVPNSASFRIESKTLRTLLIHTDDHEPDGMRILCEDLALHDWLLTTLLVLIDSSLDTRGNFARRVKKLHPAIEWLIHLWMPGARVDTSLKSLQESLDTQLGFSRQWRTSVDRIRDQLNLSTMRLLDEAGGAAEQAVVAARAAAAIRPPG